MNQDKPDNTSSGTRLRQQAEAHIAAQQSVLRDPASAMEDESRALHELRVHQIELEMQNEELRRIQVELDATRARYFDLYDLAPVGYLTLSESGVILESNLTAASLLGVPRASLASQPFSRFILPEDADRFYVCRKLLFQARQPHACELRLRNPQSGSGVLWTHLTATVAQDDQGASVCRVAITDITESKRAAEAIRESEERHRAILQTAMDGFWLIDTTGRLLEVNAAYCRMSGYGEQELLGMHISDLEAAETPAETAAHMIRLLSLGEDRFETVHRRKNGSLFNVEVSVQCWSAKGGLMVVFLHDITKRKRVEDALRESETEFRSMFEVAAIGMGQADPLTGKWTRVNRKLCNITGYSAGELLLMGNSDITHPDDRDQDWKMLQELIRGERPEYHVEKRYIHKSGAAIGVNVNMTVIRDASGHPLRTMATIEDITEKKQLEAQVLRNQRMESIGSLAGGIAHDLNNILAPILMTTSLLRQENTPSERNLIVDTVESAARRGADVINQLLTFARGKPGVLAPIPVRLLLNEMGKLIRETFPRNLQLTIDYPADLWPILGDSTQCHQALMNLCVNARDAMPNGGRLTLAARNVIVDNTVVATALEPRPGPCVCVSVTDSGCGIPPEILSRIFDPFFTTKDIGKGTGLGLPTLLGIMRGHGGFIRVSTMLGCGTTFDLFIPAVPDARAHGPAAPGPPSVQRGHEELILVVDDELVLRKAMELTLKSHGYQVLTAAEGNEALALFATQGASIKAVITDSMMPGMDGPKLVQALRLLAPQLPIIGMSGLAERADDRKSQPFNLPVVLKKPFTSEALCAALHQALSNPSACEACGSTSTSGK